MPDRDMKRYHHKVFFPVNTGQMVLDFIAGLGDREIGYTHHANRERLTDKRGIIPEASKEILFQNSNTLVEFYELEKDGNGLGVIQKLVIRVHSLSDDYDYVYVVAREGYVVSNWVVDKGDDHRLVKSLHLYYVPSSIKKKVHKKIADQAKAFEEQQKAMMAVEEIE